MTAEYLVELLHGVGFLTGATLYGMLVAMVLQSAGRDLARLRRDDGLAVITGILGLAWNLGALALVTHPRSGPGLLPVAYAALGMLPAVFVHAAVRSWKGDHQARRAGRWITGLGYVLAGGAAIAQLVEATISHVTPSPVAFQVLAAGFLVLVVMMVFASPPESRRSGGLLWTAALALFAGSAWHLGQHQPGGEGWPAVVLGHHASIPLALAILWSDYRFALADIFLKRALAVMALVAVIAGLYLSLFGSHLGPEAALTPVAPGRVLAALALSAAIALSYPLMRRTSGWFVDSLLLGRPDAAALRAEIARRLAGCETPDEVLKLAGDSLASVLAAQRVSWEETRETLQPDQEPVLLPERFVGAGVALRIPTAEPPHFVLSFDRLAGGRRVLSGDAALLTAVAVAAARRLDVLRWLHERCERDLREQLVGKLATEAELRALQAQLNPHFLFNALNTLGYLMKAAPDQARSTLFALTKLLRAVLKRSDGSVATLGEEIDLVLSYLAIEQARFEERLRLSVEVPAALRSVSLPPLLVQPLVENAIKHGISARREGGEIVMKAWTECPEGAPACETLVIEVSDTGLGCDDTALALRRSRGVGLANVEKRLQAHYGSQASLLLTSRLGQGTRVTVRLPASRASLPAAARAEAAAADQLR